MGAGGYMAIAGAVFGLIGGSKAKKAARRAAAAEARYDALQERETLRRMTRTQEIEQSSVQAQYAASGADVNVGSPLNVMAQQAAEFRRQRSAVAQAGQVRRANIRLGGKLTGEAAMWNAVSGAFSGLGSAAGSFGG